MNENETKNINKWDTPSQEDQFGRQPFVDTIVKTIQSSTEGFNLGISARWGEGKSSILKQLKPKLEKLNYKVLSFEPWKYTQDTTSIKRKFLIDIYSQLNKNLDDSELYGSTEKTKDLKPEEYQELLMSRLGTFVRMFVTVAVVFLGILFLFEKIFWDINITQIFLSNLFIPILGGIYPLVTKLAEVNIKQSVPKIESAEQFEKLFNKAIKEIMDESDHPERIIIFVDDLDRCNHVEVEQILTALFTFFNNKNCTYIITADHTVIRRYISHFLQLEDILKKEDGTVDMKATLANRQKEATEYLKKIFQINFIVPKIPSDLLEKMTNTLLDTDPIIDPKNPYGKEYLVNMVLNNFQGNPRKIKHFIRTLSFQLEAIKEKINSLSDGDEKNNLIKVKDSPELLAKILIIQDRFPDFYERIISEPKLLQRHEEGEIAEDKDLQNLIAQEPKFFNSVTRTANVKTIDPYYFLYFSGSTGYIEAKAVDPAEIKALARSGNFDGLSKIISGLTDEPRNAQVEFIKKEFDAPAIQPPEKLNVVRSFIHAVSLIEEPVIRLQKLKDVIDVKTKYDVEFNSLQSVDFSKFISFADGHIIGRILTEAPFTNINIQTQILEAFISKQTEISKGDITDRFIKIIENGIKRNDTNSLTYLNIIKKLNPDTFVVADGLQETMIATYQVATDPFKQNLFDSLLILKLSTSHREKFEDILLSVIKDKTIAEATAVISNIPTKINKTNFNLSKLVSIVIDKIQKLNHPELEQLVNILIHPAVKGEIGDVGISKILESLIKILDTDNADKKTYVRTKLPDFISQATNQENLLKEIVKIIGRGPIAESSKTISVVQGMSDFWNNNQKLKEYFVKELKKIEKEVKDKEVKEAMLKCSDELLPPKEEDK